QVDLIVIEITEVTPPSDLPDALDSCIALLGHYGTPRFRGRTSRRGLPFPHHTISCCPGVNSMGGVCARTEYRRTGPPTGGRTMRLCCVVCPVRPSPICHDRVFFWRQWLLNSVVRRTTRH